MKKKLITGMAVAAAVFLGMTGTVSAAEEELVLSFDEVGLQVTIPEKYRFVYDANQSYRENIANYGVEEDMVYDSIRSDEGSFFEAAYIDNSDYFVDTYMYYIADLGDVGNLKDYSESELKVTGEMTAKGCERTVDGMVATYEGVYYTEANEPYLMISMKYDDGTENSFLTSCLYTIANDDAYYFYTKTSNMNADFDTLFADTEELVEGVTIQYEEIAEQEETETVSDTERTQEMVENVKERVKENHKNDFMDSVILHASRGFLIGAVVASIGYVVIQINNKRRNSRGGK